MEDPPTGFRFYPTEEELVSFYLNNQLQGHQTNHINRVIPVVDINGVEPWNLPSLAGELCREEKEQWFFFVPRQEREARGGRINRTTASGYWKATGSPGYVYSSDNQVIGVKKTMVFYKGKAPTGRKTKWKMHEYRAIVQTPNYNQSSTPPPPQLRHEFSLCRVYVISGIFRAFDRRPQEVARVHHGRQQQQHEQGESSARVGTNNNGSSSSETSLSSPGGPDLPPDTGGGGGSSSNWNSSGVQVQVQEPLLWEWEQLNWP